MQAREIINVIERDNLVAHTAQIGDRLYTGLEQLASSSAGSGKISDLRGKDEGTFIAFDCATPAMRDAFVVGMRRKGVNVGGCGEKAVRLRPMLCVRSPDLANRCSSASTQRPGQSPS
jgi:4-aminobutyrate aminotransferase/(S)-3-amino-2-methylpropionate transaminase